MKTDYITSLKLFYKKYRRLPSYAEMMELFGFSSKNAVFELVNKWVEEGVLVKDNGKIAPGEYFFSLPMLGSIPAGTPIMNDYYASESVSMDSYLIGNPGYTYLLRVTGDSMIEEGIRDGDLVIIDAKREPVEGDVVAALIDNEWTLKYLKKDAGFVYLAPANANYKPFYPRDSLTIGGVVTKVIREYY